MRKYLLTFFLCFTAFNCTFSDEITAFEKISVNIPSKIRFIHGDTYEIMIHSNDKILANVVSYVIENGMLKITTKNRDVFDSANENSDVKIYIMTPRDVEPKLKIGKDVELVKETKNSENSNKF